MHRARREGLPAGREEFLSGLALETVEEWTLVAAPTDAAEAAVQMSRDLAFFASNQAKAPRLFRGFQQRTAKAWAEASAVITDLVGRLPKPMLDWLVKGWTKKRPAGKQCWRELGSGGKLSNRIGSSK